MRGGGGGEEGRDGDTTHRYLPRSFNVDVNACLPAFLIALLALVLPSSPAKWREALHFRHVRPRIIFDALPPLAGLTTQLAVKMLRSSTAYITRSGVSQRLMSRGLASKALPPAWAKQAQEDLPAGKSVDSLLWTSPEGITVKPIYTSEDVKVSWGSASHVPMPAS